MNTNPTDVPVAVPVAPAPVFRRLVALLVWLVLAVVVVQAAVAVGSQLFGLVGGAVAAVLAVVAVAIIAHRHHLGTWARLRCWRCSSRPAGFT